MGVFIRDSDLCLWLQMRQFSGSEEKNSSVRLVLGILQVYEVVGRLVTMVRHLMSLAYMGVNGPLFGLVGFMAYGHGTIAMNVAEPSRAVKLPRGHRGAHTLVHVTCVSIHTLNLLNSSVLY